MSESYTLKAGRQPGGARVWTPVVATASEWSVIQQPSGAMAPYGMYNRMSQKVSDLFEIRNGRGSRNKLIGELGGGPARRLVEIVDCDQGLGEVRLTIRDMAAGEFLHDFLPTSYATQLADAAFGANFISF